MERTSQQRIFEGIGAGSDRLGGVGGRFFDRLFARILPPPQAAELDWAADADWARLQQEPLRARAVLRLAVLVFALLVLWAALAHVDEVTRGEGRVIPSRQLQVVQSVDGGVVVETLTREGQVVEQGELLLRIDPTRFASSLSENKAQYLALQAKAARLSALAQGAAFMMPEEVLAEAPDIAAHEARLYESSEQEIAAQLAIANEQLLQRRQELNEARSRYEQATRGLGLVERELEVTRPLLSSGAVSEVDLIRLERDVSRFRGERDQSAAQISRVQAAIAEASRKVQEIELNVRNQWRTELSETMGKLGSLSAGSQALADRVKHADVRAPVRGTVSRLLVNTVGGVVQPGGAVVEIVPLDDALILEARVAPKDIAFLRPGQDAVVKFTAYDFAIYGSMQAVLEHISPDTVTDEKGNASYLVRVRTREANLGKNLPIIPGMVAEVDILTGKKTILSYLLKPVLRAKANALSER